MTPPNKRSVQGRDDIQAKRPARTTGPRWILVRQGAGPNRKWVWQITGAGGGESTGASH
jgi:hypothetical protein